MDGRYLTFVCGVLGVALLGSLGCNNGQLVAVPTPTEPPPTPTPPLEDPIAMIFSASPHYSTLDTAQFDGSGSYDPNQTGYLTGYTWQVLAQPSGSTSTLVPVPGTNGAQANLLVDMAGDYSIRLTVTDNFGLSGNTTYQFSAAPNALHVQLAWPAQYGEVDMDLHLIDRTGPAPFPNADLWDLQWDCHWRNCKATDGPGPDWGAAGYGADDPVLDIDNITTNVPENTTLQQPVNGTYRVDVHYYASHVASDIPVNTEVKIWVNQALVYDTSATMTYQNEVWSVADIVWSNSAATIVPVKTMWTTTPPPLAPGERGPGYAK